VISHFKYREYINRILLDASVLRYIIPAGLLVLNISCYKFSSNYDYKLLNLITKLRGKKHAKDYLRIYWAKKIGAVIMIWVLLLGTYYNEGMDSFLLMFGVFISILIFCMFDRELKKQFDDKKRKIQYELPEFIDKLILLINAGMNIIPAWKKALLNSSNKNELYQELSKVNLKIKEGKTFCDSLEKMAAESMIPEISKFASLIVQNIKKGNDEFVMILRIYAYECWNERKTIAKKMGEEASVKMIFPMILMFITVIMIVMIPAYIFLNI
jgi:tight adherence protein C